MWILRPYIVSNFILDILQLSMLPLARRPLVHLTGGNGCQVTRARNGQVPPRWSGAITPR